MASEQKLTELDELSIIFPHAIMNNLTRILDILHDRDNFHDLVLMDAWTRPVWFGNPCVRCKNSAIENGKCTLSYSSDKCSATWTIPIRYVILKKKYHLSDKYFWPLFETKTYTFPELTKKRFREISSLLLEREEYDLSEKFLGIVKPRKKSSISLPDAEEKPEQTENPDKSCVICKKNVKNTVNLPCGHTFSCVSCVREYVLTHQGKTCQICRKKITQVVRVYA